MLHELLEARLEYELAESLHEVEASEEDEHRAKVPAVQDGGVAEQDEDRSDARSRDDDGLDDFEDEVEPILELVLQLGPEEELKQANVTDHQAPTALYWRTPTRHTRWKAK